MVVPDIEMDDATTRSKLFDDGTGLKFAWQENDAIGIVPMSGNPLRFPHLCRQCRKEHGYIRRWRLGASHGYEVCGLLPD